MKYFTQRAFLIVFGSLLVLFVGWCGLRVHQLSNEHAELKKDYSLVNNITNGLLSVEVWRDHFIEITRHQIDEFELTDGQADTLDKVIGNVLHSAIDKADNMIDEKQTTVGGKLKKIAANVLIDEEKLRNQVPEFSRTIRQEIVKPENKKKIKKLVIGKLKELGSNSYDSSRNGESVDKLLTKYKVDSVSQFNKKSHAMIDDLSDSTYTYTYLILGVIVIFLGFWWLLRKVNYIHKPFFIISVVLALIILIVGLTTPMIEIDARIRSLDFQLIGTSISFNNQVIFYQSKSIVDVVQVLLVTGKLGSIFVGILILMFSIIFPISKLLSTGVYLLGNKKWKEYTLVKFFAFKSGKWSMADVNVIAIFMAYIGFKGILDDQLSHLNMDTESLTSISTNQTSLQPGYLIFVGFVLFGLILSIILGRITPTPKELK